MNFCDTWTFACGLNAKTQQGTPVWLNSTLHTLTWSWRPWKITSYFQQLTKLELRRCEEQYTCSGSPFSEGQTTKSTCARPMQKACFLLIFAFLCTYLQELNPAAQIYFRWQQPCIWDFYSAFNGISTYVKKHSDFPSRFQIFVPFKFNIKFSMTHMHHKSRSTFLLVLTSRIRLFEWALMRASKQWKSQVGNPKGGSGRLRGWSQTTSLIQRVLVTFKMKMNNCARSCWHLRQKPQRVLQ